MKTSVNDLRESFLKYFESKEHKRERSSALVPHNDPTLLFTNAGMVQFKDCFLGLDKRSYVRATTCQKCVRAGGKHNDLDSVGFTRRHHTFFEMLGNFSFGDYFKKDAIEFAWEFLTEVVKLPKDRLWVSVYEKDDEAHELWTKLVKVPSDRVVRMGEESNFWAMGDTGPCGPCTEIYFDRGPAYGASETIFDGGERYLEIWNLVFMQYDRQKNGDLIPLPKPSVDTGMGLERLASVLQNVDSNYLIDSMQKIVQPFAAQLGLVYGKEQSTDQALHVLTDHIRAVTFLIADGVQPSNEGRGYVLRRILRRAIRFGKKCGQSGPFFHKGVSYLVNEMGAAYPELKQQEKSIEKIVFYEEEKFFETLSHGLKLLEQATSTPTQNKRLSGTTAFQLYDTFGFPLDLTEMILRESGWTVDGDEFNRELEKQRDRSRQSWKGSGQDALENIVKEVYSAGIRSEFTGYTSNEENTKILSLIVNGKQVEEMLAGTEGEIVIEKSPFYGESGGQAGDAGFLTADGLKVQIEDCKKPYNDLLVLRGKVLEGSLNKGAKVKATIDQERRNKTRANHTTTHVLHATLREVLGEHVKQAGSLVTMDYLRFDFAHFKAVSKSELRKIEKIINEHISKNPPVKTTIESMESAIKKGAIAFFEDKYGDEVRVLTVGDFSMELCGGTHLHSLGEAEAFAIQSEASVSSGVRRMVALTKEKAKNYLKEREQIKDEVAKILGVKQTELLSALQVKGLAAKGSDEDPLDILMESLKCSMVEVTQRLLKKLEMDQKKKEDKKDFVSKDHVQSKTKQISNMAIVVDTVNLSEGESLRDYADAYRNFLGSGAVLLGATHEEKALIVVSVSKDIAPLFKLKEFIPLIQAAVSGKGGGSDVFAQLGGTNTSWIDSQKMEATLRQHLKA